MTTHNNVCVTSSNGTVTATTASSSAPSNPVPTSMLSFRFATPNNTQTPYYISSDIVLSGGIAQQNRRRIVHNEVEKRRKDKITNWIKKLAELLPRHRVVRQSKNYVLETACEYIQELNKMSTQYGEIKVRKESLEQEVSELKNKVNKLEEENKRLSQLIHKHKVTLPSTWSDASVITTTMRATSSSRNSNTQICSALRASIPETAAASQTRTFVHGSSDITPISSNSSITNSLSVTSILSSASNQLTTTNSRRMHGQKASHSMNNAVVLTQSSAIPRSIALVPSTLSVETSSTPMTISETPIVHRSHSVAGVAPASGLSQTSRSSHLITSTNAVTRENLVSRAPTVNTVVQHTIVPQAQTTMVSSTPTAPTFAQYPQQTIPASASFNRGITQAQQLRSNSVQDNISQLPYSIDALTGNLTSQNRQQTSGTGQLLGFSAESLIGRQQPSNDVVMINSPANQPVIQNTFTLTHPSTLTNANTSSSVPAQSFSNFSALSLVGSNDAFTGSATASTQTLTRSTTTAPESANISQTSNQMFTDFSTESLIGSSEFTSDFAIDNLISRSDSNVHMATVNPNLIQSFGRGNDPMISSVSGDHGNHSSHNYDSPGRSIGRRLSPHHYPAYWIF